MVSQPYTRDFYEQFQQGSRDSAKQIVPLVLELVGCNSVIDVGCGVGTWLSVFEEFGVSDIRGVDGEYVDRQALHIAPKKFVASDISKGFKTDKRFDLVVSLEVAEHIPEENTETYVDSLVNLGPVLLFSAALPFQEGRNHVNEQWPEYWVSRFAQRGFVPIDCLRRLIWQDPKIEWWYAQNIMLFVQRDQLVLYPALNRLSETEYGQPMAIVHPRLFLYKQNELNQRQIRLNQLENENEYLKKQNEELRSPLYVLSHLPRAGARRLAGLVSRLKTETR